MSENEWMEGGETADSASDTSGGEKGETAVAIPPHSKSSPAPTRERAAMLIVAGVIILLDQISKYMVEATLPLYQMWPPFPGLADFFRITHVPNTGTAFGLFPTGSTFFGIMAFIVALAIIYYNYTLPARHNMLRLALGLQLGGAIGNLIDRLRLGHVTDFLDFWMWPVFNVADMSIVSGAVLLGWLVLQEIREERAADRNAPGSQPRAAREEPITRDEWSTS